MKTRIDSLTKWIREQVPEGGKAIIGISGGKDSTIAAALCVEALGADNVIGVMMPNGEQKDLNDARRVCNLLGIEGMLINIGKAYTGLYNLVLGETLLPELPSIITTNTPARIRMTVLYMVAGLFPNSRVVNTCNYSEDYVGYSTKYGDAAGDFSPLGNFTVREVLEIGDALGLPSHLVHKAPSDGMCGKTDEDNLGFTYDELDDYIMHGKAPRTQETYERITHLHHVTRHKYEPMPVFNPNKEESV